MQDTIPQQAASAEEVAHLRNQVLDLGEAFADLTRDFASVSDLAGELAEQTALLGALVSRQLRKQGIPFVPWPAPCPEWPGDEPAVACGDPVSDRIQSRKRCREASGLRVLPGGAR